MFFLDKCLNFIILSLEIIWWQNFEPNCLFTLEYNRTQTIVSCMWHHSHLYFHLREKYEWWMGASASEEDSVWAPLGPPHGMMGPHPLGPVVVLCRTTNRSFFARSRS